MNRTRTLAGALLVALAVVPCLHAGADPATPSPPDPETPAPVAMRTDPAASESDPAPPEEPLATESDEITVWGEGRRETDYASPDSILIPEDLKPVTAVTTEDLVKYEPSVIIRRRFIGDANGTMGMRGSNMFQTTRTMVFADGIPLHYFLQTQFSGSPRWGLVNADEIGFVEVIYGPFSAEYSGNAMGGVVNIETSIPRSRRLHFEGSGFSQAFDALGQDETLDGFKTFASYGESFGRLSVYAAASELQNDSQAQTFFFGAAEAPAGSGIPVSGGLAGTDEYGGPVRYFGNTGAEDTHTDQFKLKLGYDLNDSWFALVNGGFEARDIAGNVPENYLLGDDGEPVWNGTVVQGGTAFDVRGSNFGVSDLDRRTLLLGVRIHGLVNEHWHLEAGTSYYDVLEDESRASLLNPRDPAFTPEGTVRDFDDAGWETAEVKLQNDGFLGREGLSLVTGYRYEHYRLGVSNYASADYAAGERTVLDNASGGESLLQAAFAQTGWRLGEGWDLTVGARFEDWSTEAGFFQVGTVREEHGDRSEQRVSPKLSVGYAPNAQWRFRLSAAQAYRFPIVEELFQNERRTNGTSIANADLEPEDGLHYNLLAERSVPGGHVRLNLFTETVDDVIFNQAAIVDNRRISTFLPIDEVVTDGAELIYAQRALAGGRLSVRFNASYTDAEITRNRPNPDLEGKVFPRMPEWRSNLLLNYQLGDRWDLGGGVRYASDSFGDLDNGDTADEVFGAHDAYTQVNLRSTFHVKEGLRLSAGVDNLTDEIAYVHHPWPGRTFFLEFGVDWR